MKKAWEHALEGAIADMLSHAPYAATIKSLHTKRTPQRVVKAYKEFFSGCSQNPEAVLKIGFEEKNYDQMIFVNDISLISICTHHLVPFMGKAHFAYIPDGKVVGLSKIPRMIKILAQRPQIQEKLSDEIVDTFFKVVEPKGCGVVIEAVHLCMCARGVREPNAYTRTVSLRGEFLTRESQKQEFLQSAKSGKA